MRTREQIEENLEPKTGMGMTINAGTITELVTIELLLDIRDLLESQLNLNSVVSDPSSDAGRFGSIDKIIIK